VFSVHLSVDDWTSVTVRSWNTTGYIQGTFLVLSCCTTSIIMHDDQQLPYDVLQQAFGKLQRQAREALLAEAEMQKKLAQAIQTAQEQQRRAEGLETFMVALREEVRHEQSRAGAASERYFATARTLIGENDELKKR
jgi:hypothetical protein